jgi:hypothetical protein
MQHAYEKNEALVGEGYVVSSYSFDPSMSSSSMTEQDREQRDLDDYAYSMPKNYTLVEKHVLND